MFWTSMGGGRLTGRLSRCYGPRLVRSVPIAFVVDRPRVAIIIAYRRRYGTAQVVSTSTALTGRNTS